MIGRMLDFFRTGQDRPLLDDPAQIRRTFERKRWGVFLSLTFGYGMFYTARTNIGVAKAGPTGLLAQGVFDATEMGMIGTALFVAYMIGKTLNGFLSDRANIRRFMSTALLLSAVANILLGFQDVFTLFFILWGLNGWFQSVGSAPSGASLRQWFSSREYGTRYGVWSASHGIGTAISFYVTSQLVEAFDWRWAFWAPGAVCFITAIILYRTLADRPQTYGLPSVADYKDDHPIDTSTDTPEIVARAQRAVLTNPAVWVIGVASALMYVGRYGINNWGSLYFEHARGWSLSESGMALTIYTIATVVGAVTSGMISDRLFNSKRNMPALLSALIIVGALLSMHYGPDSLVTPSLALFGYALGAQLAFLGGLWAVDLAHPRAAGAALGIIGGFSYGGAAIQDTVSGILVDAGKTLMPDGSPHYDFTGAFWLWCGTAVLSTVLVLVVWNAKPRTGTEQVEADEPETMPEGTLQPAQRS